MDVINNKKIVFFIKSEYKDKKVISLHAPVFIGNEKKYLADCINSTFVSYVGKYVIDFEESVKKITGTKYAIAVSSGTAALHISLLLVGVKSGDEVITQALTFVATANAINYTGARCIFLDSDIETLGMDPNKLEIFFKTNVKLVGKKAINIKTQRRIAACVPVHVFGHPCQIDRIIAICKKYYIPVIEDAAESMGSYYKDKHTGTFGSLGILSFNGNKIITTGGGGMILTNSALLANRAKFLTTTAKKKHPWEFIHNEVGYNYRMPNINAAVGCAQMETLEKFLKNKRELAKIYENFFKNSNITFVKEPVACKSNYWLNTLIFKNRIKRDNFLEYSNKNGVMTRPAWRLMDRLPMYKNCQTDGLETAKWLEERIVNIPSGVRL